MKKKQLIEEEKAVVSDEKIVDSKKQSFEQMMEQLKFSKPTENKIRILHERMGNQVSFGRKDMYK